jgi:hypothetical protein
MDEQEEREREGAGVQNLEDEGDAGASYLMRGGVITLLSRLCPSTLVRDCWCIDIASVDRQMEERFSFYLIEWLDEKRQEADEPGTRTDTLKCMYL